MINLNRYIHQSWSSADNLFQGDRWLYRLRIHDYQIVTIFWNFFLAAIPWFLGWLIMRLWRSTGLSGIGSKLLAFVLAFLWLLFIPNTIYIVSDVRHLLNYCPSNSPYQVCEENAWMIMFFFTYAAAGWVLFVLSMNQVKSFIRDLYGRWVAELWLFLVIPVIALGFLAGLLHRWNSWEFFLYPREFFNNLLIYVNDPKSFTNWLIFAIFLYVLYWGGTLIFKDRSD
ncbi:DUF1361 domain-containing protein [Candidatus Falkowbacteria bacterium]|nr:DUF1361 domain-containing protein [Candidatus Falkowbacteria bacterium]